MPERRSGTREQRPPQGGRAAFTDTKPALDQRFEPGYYDARFHVVDDYRDAVGATAAVPFLDVISYRFGLAEPEAHYHLPMKCTPWGYSCFRGGS
jgi:5-hydroxyisourate hydrolase